MASEQIPNLTPAISVTGDEQLEAVQAGSTVRITTAQIAELITHSADMTVGVSSVFGGTSSRVLYDNAGELGEYSISGTVSVAMTNGPTFVTPTLGVASATSITLGSTGVINIGSHVLLGRGNVDWSDLVVYGGDPTGVADSTAALIAAINANNRVIIPPGTYKFTSEVDVTLSDLQSVTIQGSGRDCTTLNFTGSTNGLGFILNSSWASVHIRDLTIATGQQGAGNGLVIYTSVGYVPGPPVSGDAATAMSDVTNVTFRGNDGYGNVNYWTQAIQINTTGNVNLEGVQLWGSSSKQGIGVYFFGRNASAFGISLNISNSQFFGLQYCLYYGTYWQGLQLVNSTMVGNTFGIYQPGGNISNAQIAVSSSEFDCVYCIYLTDGMVGVTIASSYFIAETDTGIAISIGGLSDFQITGNYFEAESLVGQIGVFVDAWTSGAGTIIGNTFNNYAYGIVLGATSKNITAIGNTFDGGTNNHTNAGANNVIVTRSGSGLSVSGSLNVAAAVATPAAGSTSARLLFGTTADFGIYYGSGAPTVSAAKGSLYMRSDGTTTNDRIYVNTNGSTTWTALITAA